MATNPDDLCLIWSFQHRGWWRSGQLGYTEGFDNIDQAGRYTREQADSIVESANFLGINEAIVPLGEHTLRKKS